MKLAVTLILVAALFLTGCNETRLIDSPTADLADSLAFSFQTARLALEEQRTEDFMMSIDPHEAAKIKQMADDGGYKTIQSFLDRKLGTCPDLDTLAMLDLQRHSEWARAAYVSYMNSTDNRSTARYTIILFRQFSDDWKINAVHSFEKDRYDSFGHELDFHETDLPKKLRFPKL